jgi:hypothetical protein
MEGTAFGLSATFKEKNRQGVPHCSIPLHSTGAPLEIDLILENTQCAAKSD